MACEMWKSKLETYLDGELPEPETRAFDAHVRSCPSCAADALAGVQMKRSISSAGKRFAPSAEFRNRVLKSVAVKPRRRIFNLAWALAASLVIVVAAGFAGYETRQWSQHEQVYSEVADLHVANLASSNRVEVVSSDRHTVKPWFQGRIPFTFDPPELGANSEFALLGGRVTYLGQAPGAHLLYQVRKHEISVFIFQDGALPSGLAQNSAPTNDRSFNMETWSRNGLRFFIISDAASADVENLAKLFGQS